MTINASSANVNLSAALNSSSASGPGPILLATDLRPASRGGVSVSGAEALIVSNASATASSGSSSTAPSGSKNGEQRERGSPQHHLQHHHQRTAAAAATAAALAVFNASGLSSPLSEPIAGPSGIMGPVQQVPLSLKKEIDWGDDKSSGESSLDFRHAHDSNDKPCQIKLKNEKPYGSKGKSNITPDVSAKLSLCRYATGAFQMEKHLFPRKYSSIWCGWLFMDK
uniref:Uncharacterized protein n=1 Tax=Anopheles culicifacies TaxID=139723 RepID=A0A182MHQ2_9DIPT